MPIISLNSINRLVFVMEIKSVICKLDTKLLYTIEGNVTLFEK